MENLIKALSLFTYKHDLDIQQNLSSLNQSIKNGYFELNLIKSEFSNALNTDTTDWHFIANESRLIPDVELYTNEEIRDYVCYLIYDFVFPEQGISELKKEMIYVKSEEILSVTGGEWISSKHIHEKLKQNEELKDINHFRLHDLKFKYLTFEWKYDLNKPYQIGFYRLKVQNRYPANC